MNPLNPQMVQHWQRCGGTKKEHIRWCSTAAAGAVAAGADPGDREALRVVWWAWTAMFMGRQVIWSRCGGAAEGPVVSFRGSSQESRPGETAACVQLT